jgi:hypothetical protein
VSAVLTVTYRPRGHAEVRCGERRYAAIYDPASGVWAPGVRRSHAVGRHRGRLAIVQMGDLPLALGPVPAAGADWRPDRRGWGWRGLNIHDDRGDLSGCIGLTAPAMLDLLGEVQRWHEEQRARRAVVAYHEVLGSPLLTVEVIHELR